jgi:hypothetical protein
MADDFGDLVAGMDKTMPTYASSACADARQRAIVFHDKEGQRIALTVLLSPAFLNLLYLNGQEKEAQEIARNLMADCGYDAFIPYFRSQAESGDDQAEAWVGQAYAKRNPPDMAQAAYWYGKAAAQGNVAAEVNLGAIVQTGTGVPKDVSKAIELWSDAAEKKSPEARVNLASLYIEGKDVPQDYRRAADYLRAAALQGHASAQYLLGTLYEQGAGVKQSAGTAYMLYDLSATNGYGDAVAKRDALGAGLSEDDFRHAHMMANRCRRDHFACPL